MNAVPNLLLGFHQPFLRGKRKLVVNSRISNLGFPIFLGGCFLLVHSSYWFIKEHDNCCDVKNNAGCFAHTKLSNLSICFPGLSRCISVKILLQLV